MNSLVFVEVLKERERARALHPGTEDMPDGYVPEAYRTFEAHARLTCERAAREGRLTFRDVFNEEVAEALAADDEMKLRTELVQVMALCLKGIEAIERRRGPAGGT